MTPHIPLQPGMKLCKDCAYFEGEWRVCTAVADALYGTPVDAVSARTGQFCGLSGALYLKRVQP